jgi:GNAT superfamily N-acetyltransferase
MDVALVHAANADTSPNGSSRTFWDFIHGSHATLMHRSFGCELEDVGIWRRLLIEDPSSARYTLYFALAFEGELVVGLAALEVYKQSRTLWLAYIAVDEAFRGKGIAKQLIRFAHDELAQLGADFDQFVLCAKRCHEGVDTIPPHVRHRLYSSLGFVPSNFDFFDCGRLRGEHPSRLCVYRPDAAANSSEHPSKRLYEFIQDLYLGILSEEGSTVTTEMEPYEFLRRCEVVPLGHVYWS